jgi:hypothetical protein
MLREKEQSMSTLVVKSKIDGNHGHLHMARRGGHFVVSL